MSAQIIQLYNQCINNYQVMLSASMKMTKGYLLYLEGMEELGSVLYKDAFVPEIVHFEERYEE